MFKKFILLFLLLSFLFAQDVSFMNDRWRHNEGEHKFITSLQLDSDLHRQWAIEKNAYINDHVDLAIAWIFSSSNNIGATYERPDFPLFSTGRFYRGELIYDHEKINVHLGRMLFDQDPVKQVSIWNKQRLSGDGIYWDWEFNPNWSFRNSIEFLPAEKVSWSNVFQRILNFHELTFSIKGLQLSIGEILLYTGEGWGVNWHHSNPFLPYTINFADSYTEIPDGFDDDNQNSLITFRVNYSIREKVDFYTALYIDDFQIDAADRERLADRLLWYNELYYAYNDDIRLSLFASLSNPAMGWHPGPFTMLTSYGFELLPHEFGEYYALGIKANYSHKRFEALLNLKMNYKAVIDTIPDNLYLWEVQNTLEKTHVYNADLKLGYYFFDQLALWGQVKYQSDENWIFNLILQTYF